MADSNFIFSTQSRLAALFPIRTSRRPAVRANKDRHCMEKTASLVHTKAWQMVKLSS
jgi:hypothetical protein